MSLALQLPSSLTVGPLAPYKSCVSHPCIARACTDCDPTIWYFYLILFHTSVCKISFVQCRNMFGNVVFLDFFMPRRCCACCWSVVTWSMQSCRACVCGFVVVLFHVECCVIIVVAFCEVTRHYGFCSWLELQSSMRQCGGRQRRSGVTTFPLAPRHAFVCWIVKFPRRLARNKIDSHVVSSG